MSALTEEELRRINQIKENVKKLQDEGQDTRFYESLFFIRVIERLTGMSVDRRSEERRQVGPSAPDRDIHLYPRNDADRR